LPDALFEFPKHHRLTRPVEYQTGLKHRVMVQGARFALHVRPNDLPYWRLGLVISGRYAPRAVERNVYKRTWRETFRQSWVAVGALPACDLIVRLLAPKREAKAPAASGASKAQARLVKEGKPGKRGQANQKPVRLPLTVLRRDARNEAVALFAQLQRKLSAPAGTRPPGSA